MRTSFISITNNIPDTQVALILLGLRASEAMLWSDILAPCTRGPRSGGVIRKTESETRPSTTWHHQWVGHNTEHHSLPWSPTQKYRSPWGFAEMESQPPAPGTDKDYLLNEGENCWCIQNMWFRIKYSHILKFGRYLNILWEKFKCCWQHLPWLIKHLLNINKFQILNSVYEELY